MREHHISLSLSEWSDWKERHTLDSSSDGNGSWQKQQLIIPPERIQASIGNHNLMWTGEGFAGTISWLESLPTFFIRSGLQA